jgi:hypothetical protein
MPRLDWQEAERAAVYDVYLWREGEAPAAVARGIRASEHPLEFQLDPGRFYQWQVCAANSGCADPGTLGPVWSFSTRAEFFQRGDVDGEQGLNITDGVKILSFLFLGGAAPLCEKVADVDDNTRVDITDGVYLLNFLFLGGPAPRPPYPACGPDPTMDALSCDAFPLCG